MIMEYIFHVCSLIVWHFRMTIYIRTSEYHSSKLITTVYNYNVILCIHASPWNQFTVVPTPMCTLIPGNPTIMY